MDTLVDNANEDALHNNINDNTPEGSTEVIFGPSGAGRFKYLKDLGSQKHSQTLGGVGNYYPDGILDSKKSRITKDDSSNQNPLDNSGLKSLRGDLLTLLPIKKADNINDLHSQLGLSQDQLESEKYGALFYFKDLRDNSYLFFRGFVEGLTDTVTPSWQETQYVGRSESVFSYDKTDRSIAFSLKMFAFTSDELDELYNKIQRMTSMCYPEYKLDNANFDNKMRSKPPLLKFRYGNLWGSKDSEIMGFLESITYTFPDNTPWETTKGKVVPKSVETAITYKVVNSTPPNMKTKFFGLGDGKSV